MAVGISTFVGPRDIEALRQRRHDVYTHEARTHEPAAARHDTAADNFERLRQFAHAQHERALAEHERHKASAAWGRAERTK